MTDVFRFKPYRLRGAARIDKTYVCKMCGKREIATKMIYGGLLMDNERDPNKFLCKKHLAIE